MSIHAINGTTPSRQNRGITAIPPATSFTQELDAQGAHTGVTRGSHHHGGAPESAKSSPAAAASAAGVTPVATIGSALPLIRSPG